MFRRGGKPATPPIGPPCWHRTRRRNFATEARHHQFLKKLVGYNPRNQGARVTSVGLTPTMGAGNRPDHGWLHWIETRTWVLSLLLVAATLALYYPVNHHPFVNYDDTVYVTNNPHVQAGLDWDTVKWAFTTYDEANWHPLTWLSHALDYQLFQLNPAGHHDINLLLHVLNVLLLFWVLQQATGFAGRSFMVAGMFAPAPEPSSGEAPATIPPKSFYLLVEEKFPLFAIAGVNAFITMQAQGRGGARNYFPRLIRLGNATVSYARYVGKAFWPSRLALFYPHPGASLKTWQILAALVSLLAVTALVIIQRRRRYLVVGWLWFVGTLVPMIGLIQVGVQAMADRYAYLPFIGLFIMICWGVADWSEQRHISPAWLASVSIAALLALTVVARVQLDRWNDNVTLWSHTLQVTGPNFIAENSLGVALEREGEVEEAITHFRAAATINPDDASSNLNIAEYDRLHGNLLACIERCKKVPAMTQLTIQKAQAFAKMAMAYRQLGDTAHARECLEEVEKIQRGR